MNKGEIIRAGSIVLPAPVQLSVDDEIIWTSDTGRTLSGLMVGDAITTKKSIRLTWGILPESSVVLIKQCLTTGFYPVTFRDDGVDITIEVYRGTLSKEHMGYIGDGIYWYRSVTATLVER